MTEETQKPKRRPRYKKNNRSNKNPQGSQQRNHHRKHKKPRSKWNAHRISEHFMKRDFDSRVKTCGCSSSLRISLGLVGIIEALRAKLNKRIEIIRGYYCPDCMPRQYGIKRDYHTMGIAADIHVDGIEPQDLFQIIESFPEIKGLGLNVDEPHVHIDTRKEDKRESWIETNNEWILLTEENRDVYIKTPEPKEATIND